MNPKEKKMKHVIVLVTILALVLVPSLVQAQEPEEKPVPTRTVTVTVILDRDGDGDWDRGVGQGTLVTLRASANSIEHHTNSVSSVSFTFSPALITEVKATVDGYNCPIKFLTEQTIEVILCSPKNPVIGILGKVRDALDR